ncbi:hypothetical protein FACS1894122_10480 [Alphaproteobacteria bacterium]|nr:hypothetical protein FACS1894122_10480 [Alphaproteobacteria bacterium]
MTINATIAMIDEAAAKQSQLIENVFIPLKIVKRGSHKGKILSKTYSAEKEEADETLINGLIKAYLWEKLIYEQFDGDLETFCLQNKFSKRYVQQVLKLNILSPKIKEAILDGKRPKHLLLRDLVRKPFSYTWEEQERTLGFC